ncbi:major histocompatibility complex class I-related gene protein-like [Entelurus aequoreus]|uniref:major histocompatibility complex class I-related gene protein-like n=1 Tax=Entelurus aequoreus TaxID=161455 RepID=UPI002B1CEDB7|nr:major histocompatibility complex class I-related gene protein-like [Entelurus aequoreus]
MNLFVFFLLVVQMHSVTPVIHTLQYFHTTTSQVPNFPECVIVGYVDGVEISYYDSNSRKAESKQDWMNKITAEEPNYWLIETENCVVLEFTNKHNLGVLENSLLHLLVLLVGIKRLSLARRPPVSCILGSKLEQPCECGTTDEKQNVDGFRKMRWRLLLKLLLKAV